ncbi:MAG: hypothetical protein LBN11_07355, partial [Tannerella sp.]|nr:hypothetical protein [Tannerella sp.]
SDVSECSEPAELNALFFALSCGVADSTSDSSDVSECSEPAELNARFVCNNYLFSKSAAKVRRLFYISKFFSIFFQKKFFS